VDLDAKLFEDLQLGLNDLIRDEAANPLQQPRLCRKDLHVVPFDTEFDRDRQATESSTDNGHALSLGG
jgi:hypothetical protein